MEMGKGKRRRTGKELVPCGGEGVMKKAEFPRTGRLPHRQAQGGAAESWKAPGTSGQKTEEVSLSQPIKSSQTVVPTRWQARGMERRPHKPHSTEGGPRGPGESRHTNLCSHKPQGAEPGPQELKELKNPTT